MRASHWYILAAPLAVLAAPASSTPFTGDVTEVRVIRHTTPAPGGRMALRYKTKLAGGAWSPEKTFYDAGIKNSYPTLIEVAPGEFRAVWDSGTKDRTRTPIQFGKFRVKAAAN
jgi:hypothetical protein